MKNKLLATPQAAVIDVPAGWLRLARQELEKVLAAPWRRAKFSPTITEQDKQLRLEGLDFRQMLELPIRLSLVNDVWWRLVDGKKITSVTDFKKQLSRIGWPSLLPSDAKLHLRVESHQSRLFHKGKLREQLREDLAARGIEIVDEANKASFRLLADWREDRLEILLALGGVPLYRRGYKKSLRAAAPIKEHLAAALLQQLDVFLQARGKTLAPKKVAIPFAGTGTFAFELLIQQFGFVPSAWRKHSAWQRMPLLPESTRTFLEKRAAVTEGAAFEATTLKQIYLIDNQKAVVAALQKNAASFCAIDTTLAWPALEIEQLDFWQLAPSHKIWRSDLWLLNPPYGWRLQDKAGRKHAASLAASLSKIGGRQDVAGLVLLPDKELAAVWQKGLGGMESEVLSFYSGGRKVYALFFSTHSKVS